MHSLITEAVAHQIVDERRAEARAQRLLPRRRRRFLRRERRAARAPRLAPAP